MGATPLRVSLPKVGDEIDGRYRILSQLGRGGMGAVFAAQHIHTHRKVAIKWMLPQLSGHTGATQRFLQEARVAGALQHPNIVDVYDFGVHEGAMYLVMELLVGEPLSAAIGSLKRDPRNVSRVLLPALRGVHAAHQIGAIHRDLKPDNIFLCRTSDGAYRDTKVLDFGISKVTKTGFDMSLTKTGAVVGTPYYMAPEQLADSSTVDARCDVYALGVILFEALTGRTPFRADTYSALIIQIVSAPLPAIDELRPGLPPKLVAIVQKALSKDRKDRFSSVAELGAALEPFAGMRFSSPAVELDDTAHADTMAAPASEAPALVTSTVRPTQLPIKRRPRGALVALFAAVVIGLGVAAVVAEDEDTPVVEADDAQPAPDVEPETEPSVEAMPVEPEPEEPVELATPTGVELPVAQPVQRMRVRRAPMRAMRPLPTPSFMTAEQSTDEQSTDEPTPMRVARMVDLRSGALPPAEPE